MQVYHQIDNQEAFSVIGDFDDLIRQHVFRLREKQHINYKQIAERMSWPLSSVSNFMRGVRGLPEHRRRKFCESVGLDYEELKAKTKVNIFKEAPPQFVKYSDLSEFEQVLFDEMLKVLRGQNSFKRDAVVRCLQGLIEIIKQNN